MYRLMEKLGYMVSRVLLEMDHTSPSTYTKICDLDRDLKQTAFILLTQKFPLVGYVITGQRPSFATLKSYNFISLLECKVVSSPLYVLESQCFERITLYYQNKLQFFDQVTFRLSPEDSGRAHFKSTSQLSFTIFASAPLQHKRELHQFLKCRSNGVRHCLAGG